MNSTDWFFTWFNPYDTPFDLYANFLLEICVFVLFVQALLLLRVLLLTREPWWRFLFLVIPLGLSIWSFRIAAQAWQAEIYYQYIFGAHLTRAFFAYMLMIRMQTAIYCLFWVQIIVAVFIGMLLWERKYLPRVERPPVWVLARDTMLLH